MSDNPTEPTLEEIARIEAPYRREIVLQDARWQSGMHLLRIRIREGHRFTIFDLDAPTASRIAGILADWAAAQDGEGGGT